MVDYITYELRTKMNAPVFMGIGGIASYKDTLSMWYCLGGMGKRNGENITPNEPKHGQNHKIHVVVLVNRYKGAMEKVGG